MGSESSFKGIGRMLWSLRVVCEGGGNIVVHGPEQPSLIWVFSSPVSYQKKHLEIV